MMPITDGFQGDVDPALLPDGTRLVFTSSRSGGRPVWTARPDGSDARPLTNVAFIDATGVPFASPARAGRSAATASRTGSWHGRRTDGRLALVNQQSNATPSIWIMDQQTSQFEKLIDLGVGPRIRGVT
jgi:hypothetical protein